MSFVLKTVSRVFQTNSRPLINIFKNNSRQIYEASVFGIKEYENVRLKTSLKASPGLFDAIKERLKEALYKNSHKIDLQDLNMYMLLCKDPNDLEIILEAFKKVKSLYNFDKNEQFGERFVKVCFILENNDKIIDALNDEEIRPSLMSQLTSFLLMNKFIIENKNDLAIRVFDQYLETIDSRIKNNERPSGKSHLKKKNQLIPFGHLRLAFEALLNINSKESFEKMKETLSKVESFKSKPNNTALACCFLLAIQQNEPNFAYQISLSIEKFNPTLTNNLKAIALLKQGRIEEAFYFIDFILNINTTQSNDNFQGKFFPDTLEAFEKEIEKLDDIKKEKYKLALKEAIKNLFHQDLYGYCTKINIKQKNK